jgi:NmrA-like family
MTVERSMLQISFQKAKLAVLLLFLLIALSVLNIRSRALFWTTSRSISISGSEPMAHKKLAVILGATRGQGRSVVNVLLKTGRYKIRGLTRDVHSPEAHDLAEQGVEVVAANLDNPHSLTAAFASAHAIFAVTTMYDGAMDREVTQGKNIADAAATVKTLEHFIWSTLPSASTVSRGKVVVPHMDGKAQVDEYILESLSDLAQKTTFYWGGFYAENVMYPNFSPHLLANTAKHIWVQPVAATTVVPMVGDHNVNTGIFVGRVLKRPDICLPAGYVFGVVDWVGHGDLLKTWAKILDKKRDYNMDTLYVHSDVHTVSCLWPGIGKELGGMLKLLEHLGKKAWTKDGVNILTMQDLELKVGEGDGDLLSTESAIRKLGSKL